MRCRRRFLGFLIPRVRVSGEVVWITGLSIGSASSWCCALCRRPCLTGGRAHVAEDFELPAMGEKRDASHFTFSQRFLGEFIFKTNWEWDTSLVTNPTMFVVICTVFMAIAVCNTVNVKMEPEVVMGRDCIETKLITLKYVHDENKAWCSF